MKFTIIVPTYKEAENIEKCIYEINKILNPTEYLHKYNILVTDANSPDGTASIVSKLSQSNPNIYLINEIQKQGLGKAYIEAMEYAFSTLNSDCVITFDADLSHDVKLLPLLMGKIEAGAKFAIGSRYAKGGGIPANWGIHRKLLSRFGNLFVRILYFNSGVTDFTSGYKAISKELFQKIKTKLGTHTGYTFSISTNVEALKAGYAPIELPYKFVDRTMGESKMGIEYVLNGFKYVLITRVKDILHIRFAKVFMSGGIGAIFQLSAYGLIFFPIFEKINILGLPSGTGIFGFQIFPRFLISQLFAIEVGILSTFLVNNFWSFREKRLTGFGLIRGILKNHVIVIGAIFIQLMLGQILKSIFGAGLIRQYVYQIFGILGGLFWNFFFYKKLIWKVEK